ncbi:hypothetical protein BGLA2_2350014 [Burkholderia gladioli]|nr:hypothetical protein BGLA2_2350014 [Burkholderia gladioli]
MLSNSCEAVTRKRAGTTGQARQPIRRRFAIGQDGAGFFESQSGNDYRKSPVDFDVDSSIVKSASQTFFRNI